MGCPIPATVVSEPLRKHIDGAAPVQLRIMAARGMVPMPPKDMVTVLTILTFDADEKVKAGAEKSLVELPERIVLGALNEDLHPLVLDSMARARMDNEASIEAILVNKATPDETFEFLADKVNERLGEMIVNNQVRILRHPSIAEALIKNQAIPKSLIDMLMDFAVRTGMEFKALPAFEEAKHRILSAPPDAQEEARVAKIVVESLPEEMLQEEREALTPEEIKEQEAKRENMLSKLHKLTAAQKVALAQKGNKVARNALVRDSNKMVATAAIRNPGFTESEVLGVVASRSICDDVLRIVCNNREWTRSYAVKLALVQNPKTPLASSMRFLSSIHTGDLKTLSMNKNIPSTLANTAKEMITKRNAGR
jgi:vacuolar-type H+-ATPase subunit H